MAMAQREHHNSKEAAVVLLLLPSSSNSNHPRDPLVALHHRHPNQDCPKPRDLEPTPSPEPLPDPPKSTASPCHRVSLQAASSRSMLDLVE